MPSAAMRRRISIFIYRRSTSITAGMSVTQSTLYWLTVFAGSSQNGRIRLGSIVREHCSHHVYYFHYQPASHALTAHQCSNTWKSTLPLFICAILMSSWLTDEVYAVTINEMKEEKQGRHWFYLAAMGGFWVNWVLADFRCSDWFFVPWNC